MKFQGRIENWNDEKGFGFVEPNGGGDRAFVHIKSFINRSRRPIDGDLIVYKKTQDKDGRYKAEQVSLAQDTKSRNKVKSNNSRKLGSIITFSFCTLLFAVTALGKLPFQISAIYVAASLVTFLAYAFDKSAALKNKWRTKESTLHLFSLFGGWPGAFYAQNKLRHKSQKAEFKNMFWVTVIINLAFFFWLFSESGSILLTQIT